MSDRSLSGCVKVVEFVGVELVGVELVGGAPPPNRQNATHKTQTALPRLAGHKYFNVLGSNPILKIINVLY